RLKKVQIEVNQVFRRKDPLQIRKGVKSIDVGFIQGPSQSADRVPAKFVAQILGEIDLVFLQRAAHLESRSQVCDANQMVILSPEGGKEIEKLVIPQGRRRFDVDPR